MRQLILIAPMLDLRTASQVLRVGTTGNRSNLSVHHFAKSIEIRWKFAATHFFSCNARGRVSSFCWTMRVRVSRYMRIRRSTVFIGATALLLLSCLILPYSSQAQGVDGLTQLLGGLGLPGISGQSNAPAGNSGQSNAPITVQRNAPPYTGMFSGKESTGSETKSLDAKLACYPAHDPAFDQTDTFICYAAQ